MIGKGGGHCRVPAVLPPTYTLLFFLLYLICFAVDVLIPIQRSEASTVIGQSTTPQCEYTYHGCCPPPRASLAKNDEQGSNCLDTQNSIYIDTRDDIWCRVNNYTAPYAPFTTDRCSIHGAKVRMRETECLFGVFSVLSPYHALSLSFIVSITLLLSFWSSLVFFFHSLPTISLRPFFLFPTVHQCSPERPCCSTSQLTQGSLSTMGLPCYINGVSGVPVLKCVRFACAEVRDFHLLKWRRKR